MRVSFVIPSYNTAEWLPHAVDSCLKQTHKDIEIVIVDDASTDSTSDYLTWLAKQGHGNKVVILRNAKNLGRSASRNIGNKAASGGIIAVLDADDICSPKRAEITVTKFEIGSVFVYGACRRMDAVGRDGGMMPVEVFNKEKALADRTNYMVHSTIAYSKELSQKYKYQDGEIARLGIDDWALVLGMAMDGIKFDFIPTPIAAYRVCDGITASRDDKEVEKFKKGYIEAMRIPA